MIKYVESEVFCFSKSTRNFNPPSLDLSPLEGPILQLKYMWKYFGFIFDNIFNSTLTKLFQLSKKWKCWAISPGVCHPIINNYRIEYVYYLLLFMDFCCNTSKVPYYSIPSRSLGKCNEKLLHRSLKPSTLHLHRELRLLLASFPYTFIWTRLAVNSN